jgi:hypothetical protein
MEKPVYIAGVGFTNEQPGRRWKGPLLLILLLLALGATAFYLIRDFRSIPDECLLVIESQPPGAEVWLNLEATGKLTPTEISAPTSEEILVQVRMAGRQSDPLGWKLSQQELRQGQVSCSFLMSELEAPYQPEEPVPVIMEDAAADEPVFKPQAQLRPQAKLRKQPAARELKPAPKPAQQPVQAPAISSHTVYLLNSDEAYRLRVDGVELPISEALQLEVGPHRLQVDLLSISLLDTLLLEGGEHRLLLPDRSHVVEVSVEPARAEIISRERSLGRGRVLVPRILLPMQLRFPTLAGLLPPAEFLLDPDAPLKLEFRHTEPMHFEWTSPDSPDMRVEGLGYVLPDRGFVNDRAHGPEMDDEGMLLGRAFHDRRPGGAHTLRLQIELPEAFHSGWPADLMVDAVDSGERFPLTLTRRATLSVFVNNVALGRDLVLDEASSPRSWPVSRLLKPGLNQIELRSTEDAKSRTRLLKVRLDLE